MKKTGIPRGGYNPQTGATPEQSKRRPFVPNAKDTSSDAQKMIDLPPTPFANKLTTAQMPTPSGASGGVSTMEPSILSGMKRSTPGARALPPGAPVGQKKPINQSGQIGGRKGFPPPRRKRGDNAPGYPAKSGANFYGE